MLGGINICLRKRDPSACMIIHILFVQTSQLHSQSVLICLVNVTITAKSALYTSQFKRHTSDVYYTAVGLEKCNGEHTETRETNYRGQSNWIVRLIEPISVVKN